MESPTEQEKEDEVLAEEEAAVLDQVKAYQTNINRLNNISSEEAIKNYRKYNRLLKPFYKKRNDEIKRIPNFWVSTFINHPTICGILNEEDEECLRFLSELKVEEFEDFKMGYRIHFHFDENPYFENTALIKEFYLRGVNAPSSSSTPIIWKEDNDLLKIVRRCTEMKRHLQSFFVWFADNSNPENDVVAEILKDDVWRNPLQYFYPSTRSESAVDENSNEMDEGEQFEEEEEPFEDEEQFEEEEQSEEQSPTMLWNQI